MSPPIPYSSPIPYAPDIEKPIDDEAEISADLVKALLTISRKTFADTHHGLRSVHAKSHALLIGELTVEPDLPPELAQGLFATADAYPVVMRFSTTPGDILPDSVSTPRGLAIKIVGTIGERLTASENDVTQDFVMVNAPAFHTSNAKGFLAGLKLLAATTDKGEGLKVVASAVLQGTEKVIEALGGKSGAIRGLGGEPANHPLGETYYTAVPLRFGDYMAKLSLVPVSPDLTELKGHRIEMKSKTAIREAMVDHFSIYGSTWELRAQLCTDIETMPIEDAARVWPEDKSPYVTVARLAVEPQTAWSQERSTGIDDGMSFSPWHGLAAHRPLGSIMRLRKAAYEASAGFRAEKSGLTIIEPRTLDGLFNDDELATADKTEVFYP